MTLQRLVLMTDRPFSAHPRPERYYPAAAIEEARQRLMHAVAWGSGPGLIIGAAGTGKSLLLNLLAQKFADQFEVAHLSCAQICTRRALLQAILFELGLPYRSRDEGDLRISLIDHLLPNERCPNGMLLLVDEAHTLPLQLLEEIRLLTNLARSGTSRVRVVLAGAAALEEQFASPELESFSQRVAARCYLAPMSSHDTTQYVRAELAAVGVEPEEVFGQSAYGAIFEATDGVPRLVSQLCDRAIWLASEAATPQIERNTIQEAWADLQQLPLPMAEPRGEQPQMESIEFGSLTEEEPASPARAAVQSAPHTSNNPTDGADQEYQVLDEIPLEQEWDTALDDEDAEIAKSATVAADMGAADSGELQLEEADLALQEDSAETHGGTQIPLSPSPLSRPHANAAGLPSREYTAPRYASATAQSHDVFEPVTVDPFDESFDDEEVVLEDFPAIDDSFTPHTPQVANRKEPGLSPMVTDVLDACDRRAAVTDPPEAIRKPRGFFSGAVNRWGKPAEEEDLISVEDDDEGHELAIHNGDHASGNEDELDNSDIPGLDDVAIENQAMTLRYPVLADSYDAAVNDTDADDELETEDLIGATDREEETGRDQETLDNDVVEVAEVESPETNLPSPGAYRQEFRQLFARLRSQ